MEIESVHKYISLNKLANEKVEVLFSGQPCLTTQSNDFDGAHTWMINPVFAKLVYGANVLEDIPSCQDRYDTSEEAIAGGLVKLHELGAFNTEIDLPEDSYAGAREEIMEQVKEYAIENTKNLTEASKLFTDTLEKLCLLESTRLLSSHTSEDGKKLAKVYKDSDTGEHIVKFHKEGKYQKNADYFADAKDDAVGTAKHWIKEDVDSEFDKWKDSVLSTHSDKKLKFKGRVENGKDTISAEESGVDKSYGVWDNDKNVGTVFQKNESVEPIVEETEKKETPAEEKAEAKEIVKALKKDKKFISKYGTGGLKSVEKEENNE